MLSIREVSSYVIMSLMKTLSTSDVTPGSLSGFQLTETVHSMGTMYEQPARSKAPAYIHNRNPALEIS